MAVPATQGKQCKYLEEMEIGDYIRCTYTATEANVAGEFSDLGGFVDTYETEQQQVDGEGNPVVDAEGNPVMEMVTKQYEEIPIFTYVSAATIPIRGYFYFLKVDKGFLVADRCVQNYVSATVLNKENYLSGKYINGKLFRVLSVSEWDKYLMYSDLNGCIVKQDVNVWHSNNYPVYYHWDQAQWLGTQYYYRLPEYSSNLSTTSIVLAGPRYNDSYHFGAVYAYLARYISMNTVNQSASWSNRNYGCYIYCYSNILYRPALEYIDNPNSKTIYF